MAEVSLLARSRHPPVRISRLRSHRGGGWGYRNQGPRLNPDCEDADDARAMSMNGTFRALPDEELDALRADPSRVEQLLYASFFGNGTNGHDELEVDKAWHGLH